MMSKKMYRKKTLSVIITLALLLALCVCAMGAAEETQALEVLYDSNVRGGPGTDYEIVGRAAVGDILQSNGKTGEWYHIMFEDGEAYISDTRVQLITPPISSGEAQPTPTPEPVQSAGDLRPTPTPDATIPASVEETEATPEPSATPTLALASDISLGPTDEPVSGDETQGGDLQPTTIILALAIVVVTLIIVLVVSRGRPNVELLEEQDGVLTIFATMRVRQEKTIFIDITEHVVFKPRVYVRIYRSLIEKASSHIYIQVGDKVAEAGMIPERGEKYSLTRINIDWDAITLSTK